MSKILLMAVKIRIRRGETIDEALYHYTLTEEQKAAIKEALGYDV